ncbi:MAG TPA: phosphodiester glycosidase family protein [Caulobacterales bacterium]|nr:phosphodiester glycosidase family protein [Caulobacterales bacterium]
MRLGVALLSFVILVLWAITDTSPSKPAPPPRPCVDYRFERDLFLVCAFDSRTNELRLVDTDRAGAPLRSFGALRSVLGGEARRVRFAMNAGMFDDVGLPIGLFVERGAVRHRLNRQRGEGNFHMLPNGVFSMDANGVLRVEASDAYAHRNAQSQWATQSGPMLVIDGALHPMIQANGPSLNIRNGVGVLNTHRAYFVISEAPVSFGRLARFFRDRLHCRNALYLDGAVSGAWVPTRGRMDQEHPLGPMILALERPRS